MQKNKITDITKDPDRRAEEYLALQTKNSPKASFSDILTLAVPSLIILALTVAFFVLPDREFSESENRNLAEMPSINIVEIMKNSFYDVADVFSKKDPSASRGDYEKFSSAFPVYMADQFPLREAFVSVKAFAELAQLKMINNGILLSTDGAQLVDTAVGEDPALLGDNIATVAGFAEYAESLGKPTAFAVAPRVLDIAESRFPSVFPTDRAAAERERLAALVGESVTSGKYVDLIAPLREKYESGEYVYYKTDHHWTSYGAYLAYCTLAESLGITPYPIGEFTRETVADEFYGTAWSSSCMHWVAPDEMEFFRFSGDGDFVTEIHSLKMESGALTDRVERSFSGFYDTDYLAKKDKYSTFIGGNSGHVTVSRRDGAERETLLIVKDSFAHSLVPFLARHFDLVIVDTRYYKVLPIYELVADADRVLMLYNVDTLVNDSSLSLLFTP